MVQLHKIMTPVMIVFIAFFLIGGSGFIEKADARSKFGGKSFRSMPRKAPVQKAAPTSQPRTGSFGRGLAGGLLGGALGGMLFGSMFGAGGQGMGLLPILILGGIGYILYRKFNRSAQRGYSQASPGGFPGQMGSFGQNTNADPITDIPPPVGSEMAVEAGLGEIRSNDPGFDLNYFKEVASDVFFQVQAGWMRRDLDSYRHLIGDQLAGEYEDHFADMRQRGVINKLESIAIRKVDIRDAGNTGTEDFVTVQFTANLLDYTVNDTTGDLVEGSMTQPVKFEEEWTWARPNGTENWKLEGIRVVND